MKHFTQITTYPCTSQNMIRACVCKLSQVIMLKDTNLLKTHIICEFGPHKVIRYRIHINHENVGCQATSVNAKEKGAQIDENTKVKV